MSIGMNELFIILVILLIIGAALIVVKIVKR
ncbi:Sec-independent protein translocase protein TatA [Carboxydothermus ferrireducens DSM 11255]|uniref:Sec-independent protein translocase protein TatA n=1 Tax=Carboxydothermus ferrireducens DSM 11255 TaxID=1119529 RepID=A0ABX2R8R3_9THEO|nr:Sec-independent protein translocase protein TatA [Carboxydothermus ferrireducens DSM 11255]